MSNSDIEIVNSLYRKAVSGINEEWFRLARGKWYDYIISLPVVEKNTYMIVVLDNQVYNGGFHQYFSNGYGQFAKETVDALIQIGAYKRSDLVRGAADVANIDNDSDAVFRDKIVNRRTHDLLFQDSVFDAMQLIDDEYEDMEGEDIVELLANFIRRETQET